MTNNFFELTPLTKAEILKTAANQLNISEIIVEKDIWICWLLKKLFSLPLQMSFKGGTSLSKVFKLINRFSEDVDITIDYRNFIQPVDFSNVSKSQLKKELKSAVGANILPFINEQLKQEFPKLLFEITLSDDSECLRFYYPSILGSQSGYLRDHVLIEFGVRNSTEPHEQHIIKTLLSEVADTALILPEATIQVLSPIRTFWEKVTLIHVECHRGRFHENPDRLSRHWYDLTMLMNSWVGKEALVRKDILENVVQHKSAFFNAAYAHYENCLNKNFKLIPDRVEHKQALISDYQKMCEAGMFQDTPLAFDMILQTLFELEKELNLH